MKNYLRLFYADVEVGAKLTLDGAQANKTMKDFKQEVREANEELLNTRARFGETSKEALEAAKKVALLKDNIKDANETVNLFDPGNKFQVIGNAVRGLVGGFTALQGALALVGVEGDEVQKTLLKVQGALALTEGLNVIADVTKDFKRLGSVLIQSLGKGGAIGVAIAGITAITAVIANWITNTNTQAAAQRNLNKSIEESNNLFGRNLTLIDQYVQRSVLEAKIAGKTQEEIFKIEEEGRKSRIKSIEEGIRILKSQQANAAIAGAEETKKNNEAIKKAEQNLGDELNALIIFRLTRAEQIKSEQRAKALASAAKFREKEIEIEKRTSIEITPQQTTVDIREQQEAIDEENRRIKEKNVERHYENLTQLYKGFVDNEASIDLKRIDEERRLTAERIILAEMEAAARAQAYQGIGSALSALSDLIGRETAAGKVLAIAQAVINTWLGVTEVLKTKSVLPEPLATISRIASVATVIASGLNAVKNIGKAKVPGSAGGSAGTSASVPAPVRPQITTTSTRLDQQQINQIGNATVRAFVVESDVSNSQERIRRLNRAARI